MIDHTGILVSDFDRSREFYARALAPLGYEILMELSAELTGHGDTAGFGEPPKPDFWITGGEPNQPPIHVAFAWTTATWSMISTRPPWPQAGAAMASPACDRTTTTTITRPSCSTPTATTSRPSATCLPA